MALQYWLNQGEPARRRIVAFHDGYHGDTFGTMAVSDPGTGMHTAFEGLIAHQDRHPLPTDEARAEALATWLDGHASQVAAILVEPLVQGAGGMRMHTPATLARLREMADRHGILLIFDEIFTGFGRTGTLFATEQAGIRPDIMTLSKALTGGSLPLAATVASQRVFAGFWSDDPAHALMHGPTYMGNALACAAALASLDLFETEPRLAQVRAIEQQLREGLAPCRALPGVRDVRVLGAIGVVELTHAPDRGALSRRFLEMGVWIRPFGKVIYLAPPFVIPPEALEQLTTAVCTVLRAR
jgi:adenosylmethionine-8-amino-7-oxononanoate aminotransferase